MRDKDYHSRMPLEVSSFTLCPSFVAWSTEGRERRKIVCFLSILENRSFLPKVAR